MPPPIPLASPPQPHAPLPHVSLPHLWSPYPTLAMVLLSLPQSNGHLPPGISIDFRSFLCHMRTTKSLLFQLQFPRTDPWEQHSSYMETCAALEVGCTHSREHHPGHHPRVPASLSSYLAGANKLVRLPDMPQPCSLTQTWHMCAVHVEGR